MIIPSISVSERTICPAVGLQKGFTVAPSAPASPVPTVLFTWHLFGSLVLLRRLETCVSKAAAAEAADVADAVSLELVAFDVPVTAASGPLRAIVVCNPVASRELVSVAASMATVAALSARRCSRQ
jgi:hypothetical protein